MLASSRLKSMQMPSLMHKGAVDEVQRTLSRSSSFSMKRSSITWLNKDRTDEDMAGSVWLGGMTAERSSACCFYSEHEIKWHLV